MLHVIEKIKQKLRVEILNGVVTVGLLEKNIWTWTCGGERVSHVNIWRKSGPGKGNSQCKGLDVKLVCHVLGQVLENYSLSAKSNLPTIFVNKVLLAHSHVHCLHIVYDFLCTTTTTLSSCNRNLIAIYY